MYPSTDLRTRYYSEAIIIIDISIEFVVHSESMQNVLCIWNMTKKDKFTKIHSLAFL